MLATQTSGMPAEVDEMEFACPNCGSVIGSSEAHPISIGCIVRSAMQAERGQRRALHEALSNDNSEIPPISQESIAELFTVSSPRYINFPPILTSMKFSVADLQRRKTLLKKIVRVCADCYEKFIDSIELRRQMKAEMASMKPKPAPRPQRLEPISLIGGTKAADRRTDMAFTDLQVYQRHSSRTFQSKQVVRDKLMHSIGGNTDAVAIDWEVVPQMAIREMRRTANMINANNASQPPSASSAQGSFSRTAGDVIFRRGKHMAPPPINFLGLGEEPVTTFDVSLDDRLMADLFAKMVGACGEFATESSQPMPPNHPLYPVYRQNHHRLPAPPLSHIHSEVPHPFENAPISKQMAVPSEIKAMEDTPNHRDDCDAKVQQAIVGMGWGGLTEDEMSMLADVIADRSIVVDSEAEEEGEEDTESDYDSNHEGWKDEGYY